MSSVKEVSRSNRTIIRMITGIQRYGRIVLSPIAPRLVSRECYYSTFKKKLDLKNPKLFNEKLMWLKLNRYANDPLVWKCVDKFAVRSYVKKCGIEEILNELYGVYSKAKDIEWNKFPDKFAIKCNHGCGYNLICQDKKL